MQPGISTHIFLPERLTPGRLDTLRSAGAEVIEVFASRHHFDYIDRSAVRDIAAWFRANPVAATMHMPLFTPEDEAVWSRHTAASLNLIDANKSARIAAMDEVKRALEAAEQIPFRSCVLHLGRNDDRWDTRALDDSLTSIEHLKAFAGPLGVKLLLENLTNDVATPEHLVEIVTVGHFSTVGFCLDLGHAHLAQGTPETSNSPAKSGIDLAFEAFTSLPGDHLLELHVHDNHGADSGSGKDEHLWPGDGSIDFAAVDRHIGALKTKPVGMLEIAYDLTGDTAEITRRAARACEIMAKL
ncbi:MAG TPA: sugar phosphate isomerase/epimerase family protein [Acidobacteriaceae bacterium]|jgi:sugar phosphate isomerase/epimerase|nr:sugar phosphate isomerase/epimerase family protein [Acidobacteriaceae bacterium]